MRWIRLVEIVLLGLSLSSVGGDSQAKKVLPALEDVREVRVKFDFPINTAGPRQRLTCKFEGHGAGIILAYESYYDVRWPDWRQKIAVNRQLQDEMKYLEGSKNWKTGAAVLMYTDIEDPPGIPTSAEAMQIIIGQLRSAGYRVVIEK